MRYTEEELAKLRARGLKVTPQAGGGDLLARLMQAPPVVRGQLGHKFKAVRTERDGLNFPSKAEAAYYDLLKLQQAAGEVIFFLMQVPFHLPGRPRYVVDFVPFMTDGTVRFVEIKGMPTEAWKLKRKLVEHHYPAVRIEVWRKRGDHFEEVAG